MRLICSVLILLALGIPAVAKEHDVGTSDEWAYFTYRERQNDVSFMVDAFSAFMSDGQKYVPLHVAVATLKIKLDFQLESFSFLDAKGNRFYPVPPEDIQKGYPRLQEDKQLMIERPMNVPQDWDNLEHLGGTFYPVETSPRFATGAVELPASTWWQDSLYFPMPKSGLGGIVAMEFQPKGSDQPIRVNFEIPLKKQGKKR